MKTKKYLYIFFLIFMSVLTLVVVPPYLFDAYVYMRSGKDHSILQRSEGKVNLRYYNSSKEISAIMSELFERGVTTKEHIDQVLLSSSNFEVYHSVPEIGEYAYGYKSIFYHSPSIALGAAEHSVLAMFVFDENQVLEDYKFILPL